VSSNFKKAYKGSLDSGLKRSDPQPIHKIPCQPQGRPPILLKIDEKFLKTARTFQEKGSVVDVQVVRATALIKCNLSSLSHLAKF